MLPPARAAQSRVSACQEAPASALVSRTVSPASFSAKASRLPSSRSATDPQRLSPCGMTTVDSTHRPWGTPSAVGAAVAAAAPGVEAAPVQPASEKTIAPASRADNTERFVFMENLRQKFVAAAIVPAQSEKVLQKGKAKQGGW